MTQPDLVLTLANAAGQLGSYIDSAPDKHTPAVARARRLEGLLLNELREYSREERAAEATLVAAVVENFGDSEAE